MDRTSVEWEVYLIFFYMSGSENRNIDSWIFSLIAQLIGSYGYLVKFCQSCKVSFCVLRCLKWNIWLRKLPPFCLFTFSDDGIPLFWQRFDNRIKYRADRGRCHFMSMASSIRGKWRREYCRSQSKTKKNKVVCQLQANNWTFLHCCVSVSHTWDNVVWLYFYIFAFLKSRATCSREDVKCAPIMNRIH